VKVHRGLPANEIHTCAVWVILIVLLNKTPFNAADWVAERGYRQYSLVPWLVFFSPPPTSLPTRQNSPQAAQVQHACAVVMGLEPGELYDTCVRSLNRSLSDFDQARRMSAGQSTCARKGLKPGTPAFADCVVDATYGVQ
jgi:hypothetical protein